MNDSENRDRNLILDIFLITLKKNFLDLSTRKMEIRIHVVIKITIPLKSKNHIPKIEIIIIPTALYNLSTKIIGAVIFRGISKFSLSNSHFNNSPTFPGVILKGNPLRKI